MADLTEEQRAATMCYIARTTKPTDRHRNVGTIVCAIVDDGKMDCAKDVAKWLKDGLIIERAPVWWCRKHLFSTEPIPTFEPDGAAGGAR